MVWYISPNVAALSEPVRYEATMFKGRTARGFTLLEVMIALVILALAMSSYIGTGSTHAYNTVYLKEKTLAHWVAMNKLAEWRLRKQRPSTGSEKGTELMGGREWRWETKVVETANPVFRQVQIEVRPEDADAETATAQLLFSYRVQ